MKTAEELKSFCAGYLEGALACNAELAEWDDWVIWGGYDVNFAGADYSDLAKEKGLRCDAYKAGWVDNIGDPIHSFTIEGNTA